jgi:hypothetical protein
MKIVPLESKTLTVLELVKLAKKQTVILTRRGKPLASIKNLNDGDWESLALASNPKFQNLIKESRQSYAAEGGIPLETLRTELGLKPRLGRRAARRA